jgi:hypothetical protein
MTVRAGSGCSRLGAAKRICEWEDIGGYLDCIIIVRSIAFGFCMACIDVKMSWTCGVELERELCQNTDTCWLTSNHAIVRVALRSLLMFLTCVACVTCVIVAFSRAQKRLSDILSHSLVRRLLLEPVQHAVKN